MIVAGFHVPKIPLSDNVGNTGGVEFWQKGPTEVNEGVTNAVISIFKVVVVAHWPTSGVKV